MAGLALALPAVAPPPATAAPRPVHRLLSWRDHATWAHAEVRWRVRTAPRPRARVITRLRLFTEDGFPEVYLLISQRTDTRGRTWVRLRYPRRPNGTTGWVRRDAFGPLHVTSKRLVVDRRRLRAILYRNGRRIWRAPVGVGKRSTPTPGGLFWVREKFRVVPAGGVYGHFAFGTAAYARLSDWPGGGVVGIHGTSEPGLIPGRPSHGCIRVRNWNMRRLFRLMPVGAPIRIL